MNSIYMTHLYTIALYHSGHCTMGHMSSTATAAAPRCRELGQHGNVFNFYRVSHASAVLAVIVYLSVHHKSDLYKDG